MEIYSNRNIGHSQSLQSQNQRLDKLLRHIQQEQPKKSNDDNRTEIDEMDKEEIQNQRLSKNGKETQIDKTRKSKTILSLADRLLLKLLLNNTSRMTGDCHVRFCERLRGKTPLDLLGVFVADGLNFI
jgi:hypothetical protein